MNTTVLAEWKVKIEIMDFSGEGVTILNIVMKQDTGSYGD